MSIYLCPALMDWLAFLILFAVLYGAGERHMTTAQCAWLGGLFQITYMVFSLIAGSILTRRNARVILHASTVLFIISGSLCLVLKQFVPLLCAMASMGVMFAFFFNSFQTYMRGEAAPGSLMRTMGIYTMAWSLGSAMGIFLSGSCYRFGMSALVGLTVVVGGTVLGIIMRHKPKPAQEPSADTQLDRSSVRPVNPAYVWIGWIIVFTTMFVQRPLHTYFPALSAQAGISPLVAAIPLAFLMAIQGAVAYRLSPLRNLLYRKTSLLIFQGSGAVLLFLIWLHPSLACAFIGISLLGIYSGFAFFASVFYVSNSRRSSFNIGINECLVGLGSLAGLFAVEAWMKARGDLNAMYLVGGLALLGSTLLQLAIAAWRQQRP